MGFEPQTHATSPDARSGRPEIGECCSSIGGVESSIADVSRVLLMVCLVAFVAAMGGFMFLAGSGVSEAFGIAFIFGFVFAVTIIACVVDTDDVPRIASFGFLVAAVLCACHWTMYAVRDPSNPHNYLGIMTGFVLTFPLLYWVQGNDRDKRGNPRRWTLGMMFQRKPDRSRPYS